MKRNFGLFLNLAALVLCLCGCRSSYVRNTDPVFLVDKITSPTIANTTAASVAATDGTEATEPTQATELYPQKNVQLPLSKSGMVFLFSSGVGAWRTEITLYPDGSFAGQYTDSDMGDISEEYPNGTVHVSDFRGVFRNITKVDDYTYTMTLWYVETKEFAGEEWIEDDIRYVATGAYGIEDGVEFTLYLPQTPLVGLSQDFLYYWPLHYDTEPRNTLDCYGLENKLTHDGFFSVD